MKRFGILSIAVALAMAACASGETSNGRLDVPTTPSGPGSAVEGQVNVTRVRVFIKDGRVQAFLQGEIGDGCTTFQGVTQRRSGNTIEITATSRRQGDVCTMIMQLLNEWVVLNGTFEPGDYTVRANARTLQFRLVRGAGGDLRVDPDPGPLPQPPYLPLERSHSRFGPAPRHRPNGGHRARAAARLRDIVAVRQSGTREEIREWNERS